MKKTVLFMTFFALILRGVTVAQNPYESIGKKAKVLTLSNGKYQEIFTNDTIVPIGSVMYNRVTGDIVAFLTRDTMYAEYNLEPEVVSRWLSPDPLGAKFPQWSPYNYANNNPINFIDPDGRSGEPVIDKTNKTVTVNSNLILYGSSGSAELATKAAAKIQNQWNDANGKTTIDGVEYSVKFAVTGSYNDKLAASDITSNTDIKNNFMKVVETGIDISYMDEAGSNTGEFLKSNIDDANSTTESHEMGHGYGLDHPTDLDLRGKGQPSIMYPRGTAVDKEYTWDPTKGATTVDPKTGAASNTMNPTTRKVTQTDINNLGLDKVKYDPTTGKGELGKLTNKPH
jgi:hypothetical protein